MVMVSLTFGVLWVQAAESRNNSGQIAEDLKVQDTKAFYANIEYKHVRHKGMKTAEVYSLIARFAWFRKGMLMPLQAYKGTSYK